MQRKTGVALRKISVPITIGLFLTAGTLHPADRDHNPPGPIGGPGTNWENPRGPAGGPGASPNRLHTNPPGPAGGPGHGPLWDGWLVKHPHLKKQIDLNGNGIIDADEQVFARKKWPHLNPPGLAGGPGAGPRRDKDDNPPGLRGGPGTNWENPPGPRGGPGASPNRRR
jgi:hypothetical protein